MRDTLRRLAAADPARAIDPEPDEELLAQTLALHAQRPRRRSTVRLAVAAGLVAAGVLAVGVIGRPATRQSLPDAGAMDLARQAYAKTTIASGAVVHTVVSTRTQRPGISGVELGSIEEWRRGRQTHRLERFGSTTALDHVIDAHGVMRQVSDDGAYRIVRASDNADAAMVIAREQDGFVEDFRARYEQGRLDPSGDVQFGGRPAVRYAITPEPATGPTAALPQPQQSFYVDRQTGEPLGYTSELVTNLRTGAGVQMPATFRYELVVGTIEALPATPENLAKVTKLSLPRRRDANGCVRAPLERARRSDSAARLDCGGTPGAVIAP